MRHTTPHTAPQPPDPPPAPGPGRPKRPTTSLNRRNPRPRDQPPDRAPEVPQRHQPPSGLRRSGGLRGSGGSLRGFGDQFAGGGVVVEQFGIAAPVDGDVELMAGFLGGEAAAE